MCIVSQSGIFDNPVFSPIPWAVDYGNSSTLFVFGP